MTHLWCYRVIQASAFLGQYSWHPCEWTDPAMFMSSVVARISGSLSSEMSVGLFQAELLEPRPDRCSQILNMLGRHRLQGLFPSL